MRGPRHPADAACPFSPRRPEPPSGGRWLPPSPAQIQQEAACPARAPWHRSAWARAPWPVALRAAALPQFPLLPVTVLSPKGRAVFSVYHLRDFNWVLLVNLLSALDIFFMQIHSYYVYVNEPGISVAQDLLWDTWVTSDSQVGTHKHIC